MSEDSENSAAYRGGEGQSVFPVPFPFREGRLLRVEIRDVLGRTVRRLAAGTDFVVNTVSDGYGEVILVGPALAGGRVLAIAGEREAET